MSKSRLNIEDLFELPGAEIFSPDDLNRLSAVSTDSRNIPADALFIAIEGNNYDGHKFIKDALNNGASTVMINRSRTDLLDEIDVPVIVVEDTIKAYGDLAAIWRKKLSTKIIAITGSAGKTTTKEMLSFVLSAKFKVNKTLANNNNHIGVPLTLLNTKNVHDLLVAELGTNHFGEIKYTASILSPDYALITNIGHSHLEYLNDKKGVLKEKGILYDITAERKGFLFVNGDDPLLKRYTAKFKNKLTYGFKGSPDVKAEIKGYTELGNPEIEIKYKNRKLRTVVPLPGEQSAFNFLAVCAVAFKLGLTGDEILSGIKKFSNIAKRLNVKKVDGFTLVDDSYNANPDSMKYSISLLANFNRKNKVIVLGDMFELGAEAAEYHKKLAPVIKKSKVNEVYTIGNLMENLFKELQLTKMNARHFIDRQTLKSFLGERSFNDSVVLVKGSRGMKMEEFVEILEGKK